MTRTDSHTRAEARLDAREVPRAEADQESHADLRAGSHADPHVDPHADAREDAGADGCAGGRAGGLPSLQQRDAQKDAHKLARAPKKFRVFLSHKVKDAKVALEVKKLLLEQSDKICVFLSSDAQSIQASQQWWERVHEELLAADHLVLLYTDSEEVWDWCLYEWGVFVGHKGPGKARPTVLHPVGVPVPSPLQRWQATLADVFHIKSWLSKFPGGEPTTPAAERALEGRAARIASEVASLGYLSFTPYDSFAIKIPPADKGPVGRGEVGTGEAERGESAGGAEASGRADPVSPPRGATVSIQGGAARIFNLLGGTLPLSEFIDRTRDTRFDFVALARLIREIQGKRRPTSPVLPLFTSPQDLKGYRPLVTHYDILNDGGTVLEIMLAPIPGSFDPKVSNAFDLLVRLLVVARQFRYQVVERNAPLVDGLKPGCRKEDLALVFQSLLYDIESVITEALHVGLDSPERMLEAFDERAREALRGATEAWNRSYVLLKRALFDAEPDVRAVQTAFIDMRFSNYTFLELTSRRVHELVTQFRPPQTTPATQRAIQENLTQLVGTVWQTQATSDGAVSPAVVAAAVQVIAESARTLEGRFRRAGDEAGAALVTERSRALIVDPLLGDYANFLQSRLGPNPDPTAVGRLVWNMNNRFALLDLAKTRKSLERPDWVEANNPWRVGDVG